MEFDFAKFGTIGFESAFGALNSIFSTKKTIELLTKGKSRFGLNTNSINVGNICDIALFNPKGNHIFVKKIFFQNQKLNISRKEIKRKRLRGNWK